MTAEKSSSTKKTTKKVTKGPSLDPMKGPALAGETGAPEITIVTPAVPPEEQEAAEDTPNDCRTEEQIRIELLECEVAELTAGVVMLMAAVSKFAVLSGNGNHLREFGLERWEPSKKDMNKHSG